MKEIIKRALITIGVLFIFEFGKTVTIPGVINVTSLYSNVFSNVLDSISMLSGGSLGSFSIFTLGVGPYITSSIIIQLLGTAGIPYIKNLMDEGGKGKAKLNRLMRYASLIIACIQGFALTVMYEKSYGILQDTSFLGYGQVILAMVAGMCVVMWMADFITVHGLGNGVSIIIFTGIISGLPATIRSVYSLFMEGNNGMLKFCLYLLMYVVLIILVVLVELSERRIPVQQSNRVVNKTLGDLSFIPLKVNSASVMPVIFASTFLSAPSMIASLFGVNVDVINKFLSLSSWTGLLVYGVLIVFFTFLYTGMQVNVDDITENLANNGSYIPGVRPNDETRRYINNVLNGITWVGAAFLLFIALLPNLVSIVTGIPSNIAIGGTGIIIAVGVAIELINNVKTMKKNSAYESYRRF